VQLCEAEAVGAVHDDGVRGRDVDAGLDDGGAQQHVETLLVEVAALHVPDRARPSGRAPRGCALPAAAPQVSPPCWRWCPPRCAGSTPVRRASVRVAPPRG